jgi:hypothetical protein
MIPAAMKSSSRVYVIKSFSSGSDSMLNMLDVNMLDVVIDFRPLACVVPSALHDPQPPFSDRPLS